MRYILFTLLFAIVTTTISCNSGGKTETTATDTVQTDTVANTDSTATGRNGHVTVQKVMGDLNNDNMEDIVVVTQDTTDTTRPYTLQVSLKQPEGGYALVAETGKLIDAQYPNGKDGYQYGNEMGDIIIEKGILSVSNIQLRGHDDYKFRYQNGAFELIGYSSVGVSGGIMETIDFNLSTGERTRENVEIETDKVINNEKIKKKISPLPKLHGFNMEEHVDAILL